VERAHTELIRAAQAMIQERGCYSYELNIDVYGYTDLTIECGDYKSFRWLVSVMDEINFFENEC
jgi:hypothetical protein